MTKIGGIFQFRKKIESEHLLLGEYVRRDKERLFENRIFNLYRFSWGGKLDRFSYLVGGAYLDFVSTGDERRLHQFLFYTYPAQQYASGFIRLGLEERSFVDDSNLYFRLRNRFHVNLLPRSAFGPSLYDEFFLIADGRNKFANGLNENRLGIGLRYITPNLETYLFIVEAYTKSPRDSARSRWAQLQFTFTL